MSSPSAPDKLEESHLDAIRRGELSILPALCQRVSCISRAATPVRQGLFVALLGIVGDSRTAFTSGVKHESGDAMRLLTAVVSSHHSVSTEYKLLLRQEGAVELKKLKMDRHLNSAKEGVGPAAVEFILVCMQLLPCEAGDLLSTPAIVQRVDELARNRRSRGTEGGTRPRANTHGSRRVRALPAKPTHQPLQSNPMYIAGQPMALMEVQSPSPVTMFARHFGLGCIPKFPKWSQRVLRGQSAAQAPGSPPVTSPNSRAQSPSPEGDAGSSEGHSPTLGGPERPSVMNATIAALTDTFTAAANLEQHALGGEHPGIQLLRRYLRQDGLVFLWGTGRCGELCGGSLHDSPIPRPMRGTAKKVLTVACGAQYTVLMVENGLVFTSGSGEWGQLGLGDPEAMLPPDAPRDAVPFQPSPMQVARLKQSDSAVRIVAGYAFAAAVNANGELFLWGNNNHSQCTVGSPLANPKVSTPIKVGLRDTAVADVACGSFFVIVLTKDRRVYSWGLATLLGIGGEQDVLRLVGDHAIATSLSKERRMVVTVPCRVSALDGQKVNSIVAGQWHAVAVTGRGEVFTWGIGHQGRLGHDSSDQEYRPKRIEALVEAGVSISAASCGSFHTCALSEDGRIFVFGDNASGQCGTPGEAFHLVPKEVPLPEKAVTVQCGREHTAVLLRTGDVVAFGSGPGSGIAGKAAAPRRILNNCIVLSISCGVNHSAALCVKRRLEFAAVGSLHAGPTSRISSLVLKDGILCAALGAGFTIIVNRNGDAFALGNNDWGQLGVDGSAATERTSDNIPLVTQPTRVTTLGDNKIANISAGYAFVFAITDRGTVLFWGNNNHSQSALGTANRDRVRITDPTEAPLLTKRDVVQIACGSFFAVGITKTGEVLTWGIFDCCGIGQDTGSVPGLVLSTSATQESRPVVAEPVKVNIPTTVAVAAGQWHTVCLTDDGSVYTWGVGHQGRLGHGDTEARYVPTRVNVSARFASVACGSFHSAATTATGTLYVWGDNESGQCGAVADDAQTLLTPVALRENVRSASCGRQHTIVVCEDGTVLFTGVTTYHGRAYRARGFEDGPPPPSINAMKNRHAIISFSGPHHAFVLLEKERPSADTTFAGMAALKTAVDSGQIPGEPTEGEGGNGSSQSGAGATSPLHADPNAL